MALWKPALVLYLHIISFMLTYAAVAAEYALLRSPPDATAIRSLGRADAVYGLSALAVFVTGVLQVLYFGKGLDYYLQSGVLWSKIGLFTLVGAASIYPTVTFLRWQSSLEEAANDGANEHVATPAGEAPGDAPSSGATDEPAAVSASEGHRPTPAVPDDARSPAQRRTLRRIVLAELVLLTLLPLLGSALTYGIG